MSPLYTVSESVAPLLRAAECNDSSRNHVGIADCIRNQLFVDLIRLAVGRSRDLSCKIARCKPAHGQMGTALEKAIESDTPVGQQGTVAGGVVHIHSRRLFGFRIDEVQVLSENAPVFRPHRVVESERCRIVTHDDDERDIGVGQTVGVLVRIQKIVAEPQGAAETLDARRVEHHAMFARYLIEPVILRMAGRLPRPRRTGLHRNRGRFNGDRRAQRSKERSSENHGEILLGGEKFVDNRDELGWILLAWIVTHARHRGNLRLSQDFSKL